MIRLLIITRKRAQMERKRQHKELETMKATVQRVASEKAFSVASTLQAVLREVQQLREKQRRSRAEFTKTLQQRDTEGAQQQQ